VTFLTIVIRLIIGILIAAAIGVALVPLLVLMDLGSGGTGWGLCLSGVGVCRNSYFSGFEMVAVLFAALFVILALIRVFVRLLRWVRKRHAERDGKPVPV
jgi:hypothetical protein